MANLFSPPLTASLPVSLGRDIIVTFRNKTPGGDSYEDFPAGVSVKLAVGKGVSEVVSTATIVGSSATCRIESTVADKIRPGALWRVIVSVGTSDEVPLNGTVVRADGV